MTQPFLSPDDLPSASSNIDRILRQQLEESVGKHLYEACDGVMQALLTSCEWYITTQTGVLMLVISCPDMPTNWRVLNNIVSIGQQLEQFAKSAELRICPPEGMGIPFDIKVRELPVVQDPL